jgi:UDP-N-acetylglucosamine transferase subunit ALG13
MIFVTVGSQLPFDRLIRAVDDWCAENAARDVHEPVFGQIADPGPGGYYPRHFEWARFITPDAFQQYVAGATLIVAHAGMGSIIAALTMAKPIVILPRRGGLGETRNDHQFATAEQFSARAGIYVAVDEAQVPMVIDCALQDRHGGRQSGSAFADAQLIDAVRRFINGELEPRPAGAQPPAAPLLGGTRT